MMNLLKNRPEVWATLPGTASTPTIPSCFTDEKAMRHLLPLLGYVRDRNYEGPDLFDGLNSLLFKSTPLYKSRLFRLALIQFCKKSPVNFRRLFFTPGGFNPKGGALFLMGHLNLLRHTGGEVYSNDAYLLYQRLKRLQIKRSQGISWGYNFDWQARAFFVAQGEPNLVTSVYVGRAMLAYHAQMHDPEALQLALGVAEFILGEMVKFENSKFICFNYIPGKDAEVHNANLLGAAYLAQTLEYQPPALQDEIRQKILKAVRFSLLDINEDGSWPYGTMPFHRWVDNFHTAFNIESLIAVTAHLQTDEFIPAIKQVTDYYLNHLFTKDGLPQYFNNKLYPIDVHVLAEAIVLLQLLRQQGLIWDSARVEVIEKALLNLTEQFQDRQGFFYYQKTARSWNRIPYIRWGQAWMFYALSSCL
ncbi:MAG: delta-aminolevulinic acid dehydratase [Vampirovibrio sp.]|jgi:hypothetical protein|nr:delta-aminolevulinic acid dehydratase [Vampirovibrio sp.]